MEQSNRLDNYRTPEIIVTVFKHEEIIRTSPGDNDGVMPVDWNGIGGNWE